MEQSQYKEFRDRVSVEYNRVEGNSEVAIVQRITVERIIFEVVVASHELTSSESIGGDINTLSCSYESSCDVLAHSCCCEPVCHDRPNSFTDYCGSGNNKVLDYIHNALNAARQTTPGATVAPYTRVPCSEPTCNDTLVRSICYQSALDDTNTCKYCHNCYFGSDDISHNIQEVQDIFGALTSAQQRTERTTTKINLKAALGKIFTEYLMPLCNISIKAIDDERSVVSDSVVNKEYTGTIAELVDAIIILTIIRHKFYSVHAGQEWQNDDILQYVLLPILLGTAKKAADITKSTLQSFWRNWLPSNVGILLVTCIGMAQVVDGAKDIDSKSLCEVADSIQQLKVCLDKIDMLKNFSKTSYINIHCIASLCSQERLSMELSIGQ